MTGGCDEVEARMHSSVRNLGIKMLWANKNSEYLADLHPGDPGLGLKEVVELVLDVLKNRRPAVGVVDRVPVPGGVDHSQGQLHSVLLQLTVVCLHLGEVLEQSPDDLPWY